MIRFADFRCIKCGEITEDLALGEDSYECECGGLLERIFTINKDVQMLPHWNEHMGHEPVYIEDRQMFKKECKKRGLGEITLKKPKNIQYYI
jgi:hypothetical protein